MSLPSLPREGYHRKKEWDFLHSVSEFLPRSHVIPGKRDSIYSNQILTRLP